MQKTRQFTQFSGDSFTISVKIGIEGNIPDKSMLNLYGEYCKQKKKEWVENNKEHVNKKRKEWENNNKEQLKGYNKEYRILNEEKIKEYFKEYYIENKKRYADNYKEHKIEKKNYNKKYHYEHKEERNEYHRKYKANNPEKIKQWIKNNPEKIAQYNAKHGKFGFNPINDWFKNSNYHHLHIDGDHDIGIFIPTELHRSVSHRNYDKESMNKINKAAFEWYEENK